MALAPFRAADHGARPAPESEETRERLRALGYVASGTGPVKTTYGAEDDPKRLIALDAEMEAVVGSYVAGDLPAALARARGSSAGDPACACRSSSSPTSSAKAGTSRPRSTRCGGPSSSTTGDDLAASLLGSSLVQAGRPAEALAALAPLAAKTPPDVEVLTVKALALARLGRTPEALATLAQASEVDPSNAMVAVHAARPASWRASARRPGRTSRPGARPEPDERPRSQLTGHDGRRER